MRVAAPLLFLCLLVAPALSLWPQPQRVTLADNATAIELGIAAGFDFEIESNSSVLHTAAARYRGNYLFPLGAPSSSCVSRCLCAAQILVQSELEELQFGTDESYRISISADDPPEAVLTANTIYGAIRALETFAQLVEWSDTRATYTIKRAPLLIEDWPRFPWRGLLIDTGRHFQSLDALRRMISAIAINKMNTMHWHLTDAQSFPLKLASAPLLAEKGSYAADATYTTQDIADLVAYARTWGVRIVPELDMPSHVLAWSRGYPFASIKCTGVSDDMVPFDPTSEELYTLLDNVFGEIAPLFQDAYIHIGGDEVKTYCWERDAKVAAWMRAHDMNNGEQLWSYFATRLRTILEKHGWGKFVMWYEMYQHNVDFGDLNSTLTQVWMDPNQMPGPVNAGRKTLLSGGYYLDQQVPDSHNSPNYLWVDTWTSFWRNDPHMYLTTDAQKKMVQGGEACMWGEQVDSVNIDGRIWPRAAGTAERLWSPPTSVTTSTIAAARVRLVSFRCRLARLGIRAGPVTPDYCPLEQPSSVASPCTLTPCVCVQPISTSAAPSEDTTAPSQPLTSTPPPETDTPPPRTPMPSAISTPSPAPASTCPVPHTLPACLNPTPTPCLTTAPKVVYREPIVIVIAAVALTIGVAAGFLAGKLLSSSSGPVYSSLRAPAVEARSDDSDSRM